MEKPNLAFFPYSIESLSISNDPKPEPVPPPNEWKTTKPDIVKKGEKPFCFSEKITQLH